MGVFLFLINTLISLSLRGLVEMTIGFVKALTTQTMLTLKFTHAIGIDTHVIHMREYFKAIVVGVNEYKICNVTGTSEDILRSVE